MPTSAPGSRPPHRPAARARVRRSRGFTLIELLVVIAIIALSAGLITLALPDAAGRQLEQEAERLGMLLEDARSESRGSGTAVVWMPVGDDNVDDFRFVGLRPNTTMPTRWLDGRVSAQVIGGNVVTLGPDAILAPQRIVLRLDERRIELATDGLAPFAVAVAPAGDPP
jgi:general secretion pathway protein H